jgi:ATP-dependent exoDNAse (exonuclease V) beta subunit
MANPILKLEASAGSGKTYRLALEYLARLLGAFARRRPQDQAAVSRLERELLGSVLAITFTVKAAQEMKRRIVQKLKAFALADRRPLGAEDEEFFGQLARATRLPAERITGLSRDLIDLLLARYDDFNVKTIDSLMSAMVKVIAPDLDLPADYEIAIDARDELEARGRALLSGLADDDWERLEPFLREFRRLDSFSGWQTDVAVCAKVTGLFRKTLKEEGGASGATADELRRRLRGSWEGVRRALEPFFALTQEKDGKGKRYASGRFLREPLVGLMAAALSAGEPLPLLAGLLDSPYFRKDDPDELLVKDAPEDFRRRFIPAYRGAQGALREAALDFSVFKTIPYREFLEDFARAWRAGKETVFVEEFSRILAERFAAWGVSGFPYLYMKMSDRFRHFLFDEFQDTSTLQFKALAPLIDEVLAREKNASLFIVGDRKQAIYRWRGGNSRLMDESVLEAEIGTIANRVEGSYSHSLAVNWRSRREIVEFNNRFWDPQAIAQVAVETPLQAAIRANFADSRQELPAGPERQGGYVELTLQAGATGDGEGEEEDLEAEGGAMATRQLQEVKAIIARLHGLGYAHSDIAVLVRKNAQVRDLVRSLGQEGIDTISDQSLMLDSNPRVNEIVAFLRFLDFPPDDLSFHAFVSGRMFRRALARFPQELAAFGDDALLAGRGPLYKRYQESFPASWAALIEPFFQAVGFLPPYDLFSDMTQAFQVYENFPDDTPFLMALGDALHAAERAEGNSIAGFLLRWQKMVADEETPAVAIPEHAPGVRVLTMHQSKGLEFPAVIVPLDGRTGRGDDALRWEADGLYHITKKTAQSAPGLRERYEAENVRCGIDLLNLLYVAFTRAREALFVPVAAGRMPEAPEADPEGIVRRLARASDIVAGHPLLRWVDGGPSAAYRAGRLERRAQPAEQRKDGAPGAAAAAVTSKRVATRSWQEAYLVFDRAKPGERRDAAAAERGERVHDLLSRLGDMGDRASLAARVQEQAARAGWPQDDADLVSAFLAREDVHAVLSSGEKAFPEKEVAERCAGALKLRRLDRLQVGAGEVRVVDFKTGTERIDDHASQVRGYMAAVAPLYPGRACRGFLLYIDRGEILEVACSS